MKDLHWLKDELVVEDTLLRHVRSSPKRDLKPKIIVLDSAGHSYSAVEYVCKSEQSGHREISAVLLGAVLQDEHIRDFDVLVEITYADKSSEMLCMAITSRSMEMFSKQVTTVVTLREVIPAKFFAQGGRIDVDSTGLIRRRR